MVINISLIAGYPNGSDLTLINIIYHKAVKDEDGKYGKDGLSIIYRDNKTMKKKLHFIEEPEYTYYKLKEDFSDVDRDIFETFVKREGYDGRLYHNPMFIEKELVDPITCKYNELLKSMAESTDNLDWFYDNLKSGNFKDNKLLFTHENLFQCDIPIEDYYRKLFRESYVSSNMNVSVSFFDIEVDISNMMGDFPQLGECPVNSITLYDGTSDNIFVLGLKDEIEKDQVLKIEKKLSTGEFEDEIKELVKNVVGGEKNLIRYKLENKQYRIKLFDNEKELLRTFCILINKTKPDFIYAWNMSFDTPYIIQRLYNLNMPPELFLCHPEFPMKTVNYYVDEKAETVGRRGDICTLSSFSVWLDQMVHFASIRKSESTYDRFSLDYIANRVCKIRKLDYSHITLDIKDLPYLDFDTFLKYNIIDVINQVCIENKTKDINYLFEKAYNNNTIYFKEHMNTLYLKNRASSILTEKGYVFGNNTNIFNTKESYPGGVVGDPTLLEDIGLQSNNITTRILKNIDDYDFKSLYPSLCREFNLSPTTLIAKILMDKDRVFKYDDGLPKTHYIQEGMFIEDLIARNYMIFGHKWFDLANIEELIFDINEYLSMINYNPFSINPVDNDYRVKVATVVNEYNPAFCISKNELITPVSIYKKFRRKEILSI